MSLPLLQSMILMATVMAACMSIVLYAVYRSFPREIAGIQLWSAGALVSVVIGICYGINAALSAPPLLMLANLAVLLSNLLFFLGTLRFYQRRPNWLLIHTTWLIAYGGISWFMLVQPNFAMRVAFSASCSCIFYLAQLYLIIRYGERHFSSYFFAALIALHAGNVAVNAVHTVLNHELAGSIFNGHIVHMAYLYISTFTALLLGVGFMTVCMQRLQLVLEHRSCTDPLTDALNRRGFSKAFQAARLRMQREHGELSCMVLDIDFFKKINDAHGHATGDLVLIHTVGIIRRNLRGFDCLARFGGEEFVALFPATDIAEVCRIAARVRQVLAQQSAADLPAFTVSIGVAGQLSDSDTAEQLLGRADQALYRAKQAGRNQVWACDKKNTGRGLPVQGGEMYFFCSAD